MGERMLHMEGSIDVAAKHWDPDVRRSRQKGNARREPILAWNGPGEQGNRGTGRPQRANGADKTGMPLQKAFTYLNNVTEHKQVIPFRRFAGGIGRASQAKEFKTTKGEFLECFGVWAFPWRF